MHGELTLLAGAAVGFVTGSVALLLRRPSVLRERLATLARRRSG